MTEAELDKFSHDLSSAWQRYAEVFGEAPHGTPKQLRAMLCFLPKPAAAGEKPGMSAGTSVLREELESHLDEVDAALFSGDSFEGAPAIARLRYYLARWERELAKRSAPSAPAWESALLPVDASDEPVGGFSGPSEETERAPPMPVDAAVQALLNIGFEVTFRPGEPVGNYCRVHRRVSIDEHQDFRWGRDINAALTAAMAVAGIAGRSS